MTRLVKKRIDRLIKESEYKSRVDLENKLNLAQKICKLQEGGERPPSVETLVALAYAFNVNIDYLVGSTDQADPPTEFIIDNSDLSGRTLKYGRSALNISVPDLAGKCGLSKSSLYRMEKGAILSTSSVTLIHQTTGLSYDFLIRGALPLMTNQYDTKYHQDRDVRMMKVAREHSTKSVCRRRRVGAIITKGNSVISYGFNRPLGDKHICDYRGCRREHKGAMPGTMLESCRAMHAEVMAIMSALKAGYSLEGCTIYVTAYPCSICANIIVDAGIKRVVFGGKYPNSELSIEIFSKSQISVQGVSLND